MQLIADAAFAAESQHGGAFVAQSVGPLEAAELAPRAVEFAGHA
jgi:hypothetical protein